MTANTKPESVLCRSLTAAVVVSESGERWRSEELNNHIRVFNDIINTLVIVTQGYIDTANQTSLQMAKRSIQRVSKNVHVYISTCSNQSFFLVVALVLSCLMLL